MSFKQTARAIAVVYEDNSLLVINKPFGLTVHPKHAEDKSPTLIDWLKKERPEVLGVGEDSLRPGIVHRLDKDTSGLMIIAKNNTAFVYLKNLFQEHKIQKTYMALVYGKLKEKRGVINTPLGKIGTKQSTRIHGKKELNEKEAITNYEVLEEYDNYSLLQVKTETGRMHQIRIHLNSIGHPIVCDPLYGGRKKECPPGLNRLFLHAQGLSFTAPDGSALAFEAELPRELASFIDVIGGL